MAKNLGTWVVIIGIILIIGVLLNIALSLQISNTLAEIKGTAGTEAAAPTQQQAAPTQQKVNVAIGDAPVKGKADAKVTIIEFSDPSCPFCGAATGGNAQVVAYLQQRDSSWTAPVPGIMKDYVDTGKVKIAFKYFPGHGKGADAMKIMWCSNDQGKFWEVHDKMFANQDKMEAGDTAGLKKLAVDAGVDSAKLESCLSSGKYDAKLQSDMAEGRSAGVSGTPAFIINGQMVVGAQSYTDMKQVIDAALAS